MCIRRETREKARRSLAFSRVSKPHTHITHMLRQCTSIVFILAAILKILKSKKTTLTDDIFLCLVSKESAVRSEFHIFCTLVTIATAAILNFFQPPQKLSHTTVDIPTKFHEV
jgi:hypothetical protein